MKKIILSAILITAFYTTCTAQDTTIRDYKDADANFKAFLNHLFKDYISLKNALAENKVPEAQVKGQDLTHRAENIIKNLLPKVGLTEEQKSYAKEHLNLILKQNSYFTTNDIKQTRKAFEVITQSVYCLIKSFKPNKNIIYKQYCATAFDGKGAYWLSTEKEIMNPYLDKGAPQCGEVEEEL